MATHPIPIASLRSLKNALLDRFPSVKSAHLSEAIAAATGFRTHAALLAYLATAKADQELHLGDRQFVARLRTLGYSAPESFGFGEVLLLAGATTSNQISNNSPHEDDVMAKVFFSYSHADEALRDRLEVHLSMMKNQKLIETWHDRRISAGSDLNAAIDENLESADVILLLVSADFLASWYCYSIEMKRALERHEAGTARVIPVIVEPCDWHPAPFGKLLAVPRDGKAVTTWANQAEAWADVAKQVRKAVEEVAKTKPSSPAESAGNAREAIGQNFFTSPSGIKPTIIGGQAPAPAFERPRSSNLRLKKEFSDFDRDKFLHDAFDYMGKFFQASLEELAERNPGIQGRYNARGAESFSAVIYRDGKAVAECSISIGGFSRASGLSFSHTANASPKTFNEMLTIESDSQSMYFKSMGMQRHHEPGEQLSEQGASEYFWGLLIAPLQR